MENLCVGKKIAENLLQLLLDTKEQFPIQGEGWERFDLFIAFNVQYCPACNTMNW